MSRYPVEGVHISKIRIGDAILHQEREMTVCAKDIKRDPFFGLTLFGDSYRLGLQPVKRLIIQRVLP